MDYNSHINKIASNICGICRKMVTFQQTLHLGPTTRKKERNYLLCMDNNR